MANDLAARPDRPIAGQEKQKSGSQHVFEEAQKRQGHRGGPEHNTLKSGR